MRPLSHFSKSMLAVVLSSLFLVMSTAFIVIPQATSGHPGDIRGDGVQQQAYHPT